MKLPDKRHHYSFAFAIGILLFLICHLYDLFFHYDQRLALLAARITISIIFGAGILCFYRIGEQWLDLLAAGLAVLAGVAVTVMALITGEGFASPIYAGQFIVIMAFSLLFQLHSTIFSAALGVILIQHFFLLSLVPSPFKFMVLQLLALPFCATLGALTQHLIYNLFIRTQTLENFLPICAKCKKIRDDQGYWNQVEEYIAEHFKAEFTHSICEDCAVELYGTLALKAKQKIKNRAVDTVKS